MRNQSILRFTGAIGGAIALVAGLSVTTPVLASDDTGFTIVSDLDTFKAQFMGPKIMDPKDSANYFVIREDGTIDGLWFGKTMTGAWHWEDKYFCRSLSAPRPAPEDCQEWSYGEGKAKLVRNRGTGEATVYSRGE